MAERILVSLSDRIATLTLNRPEKLNAIDPQMLDELEAAIRALDANRQVRVVLLMGVGERAFSVGADINAWAALSPLAMWAEWVRRGHRIFAELARLRQPTIAVLHGYAFGGGLEVALSADLRLAGDQASFAMPEVKLGTVPGWAGTARLPALIGVARAKQMIFSGARIDAATAERWGLVNETVPEADLLTRAQALAAEIAGNAPHSVQIAKQILSGDPNALESLAAAVTAASADGREGLTAYRERRPAQFDGNFEEG